MAIYCPSCGGPGVEGQRYCRSCGTDLELVSRALTGSLVPAERPKRGKKMKHGCDAEPRIDQAIQKSFLGFGFALVALGVLFFAPGGSFWWFWLLIPAFALLGAGVAEYVRWRTEHRPREPLDRAPIAPPEQRDYELPPPSVVEHTTLHLDERLPERER